MKEYTLTLTETEFHDLKTMVVLLKIASLSGMEFTEQQKQVLSSVDSIAKKIDEVDPSNKI